MAPVWQFPTNTIRPKSVIRPSLSCPRRKRRHAGPGTILFMPNLWRKTKCLHRGGCDIAVVVRVKRLSPTFRNVPARAALPCPIDYPRRRSAGAGAATLAVMELTRIPASGDTVVNVAGQKTDAWSREIVPAKMPKVELRRLPDLERPSWTWPHGRSSA